MKQRFRLSPKPTETCAAVNARLAASVVSRLLERGHRDLATAVAVRVAAGLAQDLTAKMEALLRDFSVAESKKLGEWFAQTFGRVTQSSTPRGGKDVKKVAEAMLWELRNRASQSKDLEAARKQVEHVWRNQMLPLVPQLIKLFSEEGGIDVPIESRIADRVYENRAGLTGPKLRAFTTKLEGLWNSLKGWRRHALKGELRVVLAGPRDFRGTAAGTYKSQQDTLFVRATPAVMKRQAGTYASPDYILVHELGHRYEYRVGRLPTDFDQSGWATTPYSHKEGERFAELFALGHFGLQNWGSTRFDDVVDRFESVMSGRQQAVGAGPTSPPMPFKLGDEVLYGKYKNHRGRIIQFGRNPKGQITVQIEPIPKGRKKTKEMGLFKIWTTPDAIEGVTK